MTSGIVLPVLDVGIKYTVLIFCSYYVFMRCAIEQSARSGYLKALMAAAVMGFSLIWLRGMLLPFHIVVMLMYLVVTNYFMFRQDMNITVVLSALSYGLCEAVFLVVGFLGSVVIVLFYWNDEKGDDNSIYDFLNDIPVHIAVYITMLLVMIGAVFLVMRSKRLCNGLKRIVSLGAGGTGIMIMTTLLMCVMGFELPSDTVILQGLRTVLFICSMVMCILITFWIKKEISSVYLRLLLDHSAALTEGTIAEKDKLIAQLRSDNERLAGIIRSDSAILPEMTDWVRKCASGVSDDAEITDCAERLERLYGERTWMLSKYESQSRAIAATGVQAVDNVLLYMADRAENSGVDFSVDVEDGISQMFGGAVNSREFNTMLADLAENAIISARQHLPGKVAVKIRNYEGNCCLEVLDSGDEFNEDVLRNMGIKKTTTHQGEGGSGVGLMTLFKIIKHNSASLTIEEYPEGEKYSKAIRIIFDQKSRRRIATYRADELRRTLRLNRFSIESINTGSP